MIRPLAPLSLLVAVGVVALALHSATSGAHYVCGESGRALPSPCAADDRAHEAASECCDAGDGPASSPAAECCEWQSGEPSIVAASACGAARVDQSVSDWMPAHVPHRLSFDGVETYRPPAPPGRTIASPRPSLLCRFLC